MPFKHSYKNVDNSEALNEFAEARFDKIDQYLLKESNWKIYYSHKNSHECQVQVTISNPMARYVATASGENFYQAVEFVCDKLSRQVVKKKERIQKHKNFDKSKEAKFDKLNARFELVETLPTSRVSSKRSVS